MAYYKRGGSFIFTQASANDFSPLLIDYKNNSIYQDYDRILYDKFGGYDSADDFLSLNCEQVNELFVEKPVACSFITSKGENFFTPTKFIVAEYYLQHVQFRTTIFDMPEELINDFDHMKTLNLNYPNINQISNYYNQNALPNFPSGIRQLVFSVTSQYAVNSTFRGRQTMNTPMVQLLINRLRTEYGAKTIEVVLSSAFNAEQIIVFRVDLSSRDDGTVLYVRIDDTAPLYATLRFPVQMLVVNSLQSVYSGNVQGMTKYDDFESNVIVANAAFAAATIGGGVLSGLGQGLGQYAQTKAQLQMQDKYLAWQKYKQHYDYDNQKYLQQSMFDFKAHQQQNEFEYNAGAQMRNIAWAREQQTNQNQFTKELVETNLESDIRRARNAQQLAGYRTDATVSGLNFVSGRGGLGHPDAPRGMPLPPRSVSTQTNSPKVYLTRPTGYYTGPLSSEERL
uniref:Uncharacterized protein n=1 Tax=Aphis citricidus picorna-like virus TaxID=2788947 RepID=A0A7S8F9F9_9VIRU|nr:hypothetical protein [Aphis citricidus picorna-like virus]